MFLMMLKKDTTQFMSIFKRMPTDDGDGTVIRRWWLSFYFIRKLVGIPVQILSTLGQYGGLIKYMYKDGFGPTCTGTHRDIIA